MWSFLWTWSTTSVLFLALGYLAECSQGNARQYIVHTLDESLSKTDSEDLNYHDCYITVQETRRVGGQCVKIRENINGCVAGSLIDPFHQDCL